MVIARFHRTLAVGFFLLLIAMMMAAIIVVIYWFWGEPSLLRYWFPGFTILAGLFCIVFSIAMVLILFRDPRAIWIEDGTLYFYSSVFSDIFFFLLSEEKVPLGSISGLSSVKAEFPGAVNRRGIYVDLKSGKSHKILTFLLGEREEAVMERLRTALAIAKPKADGLE